MRSPVLFIVFNRPDVTRLVFEAIATARPPRLYVAADGPRAEKPEEAGLCAAVRDITSAVDWPCEVKTLFRKRNLGCRSAVASAITWFFQHEPEGIILEDDVLPHQAFFPYCDALLERYRAEPRVMQITANNFQLGLYRGSASYYFSNWCHIWGWASWARAWKLYDRELIGFRHFLRHEFPLRYDLPGAAVHLEENLAQVANNTLDTWDYSLTYALFRHNGLVTTPNWNLTRNIGFGSGVHCTSPSLWAHVEPSSPEGDIRHPAELHADAEADRFVFDTVFKPGGTSKERLLQVACERLECGQAYANKELLRMVKAFYGDCPAVARLEAASLAESTDGSRG